MSKGYIPKDVTFPDGRLTQYMHQIACIYIVVSQQKWNNTYLETMYKLEGENMENFCSQDKFLSSFK